jgi:hypothetical protein
MDYLRGLGKRILGKSGGGGGQLAADDFPALPRTGATERGESVVCNQNQMLKFGKLKR